MKNIELDIRKMRFVRKLVIWLDQIILPGFQGVSLYESLRFFIREIVSQRFMTMAQSVSFSFLMSIPPFLLFLFTLIPYLPISSQSLIASIVKTVGLLTQSQSFQTSVNDLLQDFFLHKKEVLLSFSVFLTLFFSSNGLLGLMNGFDRNFEGFKKQDWLKNRMLAIALTIIFMLVMVVSFSLLIFQAWLFDYFGLTEWHYIGKTLQYIIIAAMLMLTISIIYRYGPSTYNRWPLITPGSILTSFLIILVTLAFFFSVNHIVNYNQIYGSVGTLIIFLVWLFSISQILLIGFELNVSIFVNKARRNSAIE